jgi:co-chaperonin GroES (HSP10)
MTTEVFPLGTKLLAAEVKKERKSEAGIILENTKAANETAAARVLAVGPDVTNIKVGNEVYIDWAKTKLVVIDGAQRVILDQEDVHALIVTA